jgi:hypothetical protein
MKSTVLPDRTLMGRMAMNKLIAFAASVVLVTAVGVQAHEGHAHKLMGTVKAVHADVSHVELTAPAGKTAGFYVNADTMYMIGSAMGSLADLKPGTRVVVETKMDGDKMVATHVKLSAAPAAKAATTAAPHKY